MLTAVGTQDLENLAISLSYAGRKTLVNYARRKNRKWLVYLKRNLDIISRYRYK
jgi:hypothetical protein